MDLMAFFAKHHAPDPEDDELEAESWDVRTPVMALDWFQRDCPILVERD
jgi:hypothetical protein